jgi:uncharacterized membrane protein (UPF0136 family)
MGRQALLSHFTPRCACARDFTPARITTASQPVSKADALSNNGMYGGIIAAIVVVAIVVVVVVIYASKTQIREIGSL